MVFAEDRQKKFNRSKRRKRRRKSLFSPFPPVQVRVRRRGRTGLRQEHQRRREHLRQARRRRRFRLPRLPRQSQTKAGPRHCPCRAEVGRRLVALHRQPPLARRRQTRTVRKQSRLCYHLGESNGCPIVSANPNCAKTKPSMSKATPRLVCSATRSL